METQKNDEKNIVLELKRQLGRMMVQVDYMYRNDRELSRLDLDILMERTRDLYDLLCDYQAGTAEQQVEEQPLVEKEINEGGELINRDVEFEIEDNEDKKDKAEQPVGATHVLPVVEDDVENDGDDDDEEDWEDEDDEMFRVEQEDKEENEDKMDKEEKIEDNSLAARLQRTPITDIRMAMGINDKVMIINDLFMGSVERYNKSIDALNEFPTLSGAKVYMSELQIELQWDVESQAYKMLNDLVERRFI